jgi:hypothetical protein
MKRLQPNAAKPSQSVSTLFRELTATGMRRSELVFCKWGYVEGARILLPTSKNDEPKEVHLNTFAQQVLASIPQGGPEDRIFPDIAPDAVTKAFQRLCKALGIVDIRLHDLRHTFATWLRQNGVELDVIASQLGHRDLRMTKRYARIAPAQVRKAGRVRSGLSVSGSGRSGKAGATAPSSQPESVKIAVGKINHSVDDDRRRSAADRVTPQHRAARGIQGIEVAIGRADVHHAVGHCR